MKNFELFNIVQSLNRFELSKTALPVKVGYTILQNRQKMRQVIEPFVEARNEIIKKYSNGTMEVNQQDAGYAECLKEIDALGSEECEIEFKKIKLSDIECIELSTDMISALMCMIEE